MIMKVNSLDSTMEQLMYHFVNHTPQYVLSRKIYSELPYRTCLLYREVKDGVLGSYELVEHNGKFVLLSPTELRPFLSAWGLISKIVFPKKKDEIIAQELYEKWVKSINQAKTIRQTKLIGSSGQPLKKDPPCPSKVPERFRKGEFKLVGLNSLPIHYPWIIEKNKQWWEDAIHELAKEKAENRRDT